MPSLRPRIAAHHAAAAASALAIALCGAAPDARAQAQGQARPGPGPGAQQESTWSLGIGAFSEQKPYAGIDRDNKALPLLHFENRYVRVFGPGIEAKLPGVAFDGGRQSLDFRVVGQYHGAGYEADDAPVLSGMAKRKSGFWAGGKVKWDNPIADLTAEWLGDASGHSKGQRFTLGVEKNWRIGSGLMVTPRLAAHWLDKKYVGYYFGVREDEARAGRAVYAGKSGVNAELGLRAVYRFDAQQSLLFTAGVTGLAKGIKDSPLVDRSTENRVLLGYMYRFR